MTNECEICGKSAIGKSQGSLYRFVPISDNEKALVCKSCADKVHAFTRRLKATRGVLA